MKLAKDFAKSLKDASSRRNLLRCVCATALFVVAVAASFFTAEAQRSPEAARRLPLIYWTQGIETATALKQVGIEQIAVPPDKLDEWRKAGFNVLALSQQE